MTHVWKLFTKHAVCLAVLYCTTSIPSVPLLKNEHDMTCPPPLPPSPPLFSNRHKVISADTKIRFAETKHEVTIMRQEEKKLQTQTVGGKQSPLLNESNDRVVEWPNIVT